MSASNHESGSPKKDESFTSNFNHSHG